jgi:hypothetical protein
MLRVASSGHLRLNMALKYFWTMLNFRGARSGSQQKFAFCIRNYSIVQRFSNFSVIVHVMFFSFHFYLAALK